MAANQSIPGFNRVISSNIWWLRNANHVKFTEERMICIEKQLLSKKSLQID